LGNILADATGLAEGTLYADTPLEGDSGILGRSVVVHAGEDDLGLGGNPTSRTVGNAGARPACGTIVKLN
jgi:Cu-Zn family superoxide dismutase